MTGGNSQTSDANEQVVLAQYENSDSTSEATYQDSTSHKDTTMTEMCTANNVPFSSPFLSQKSVCKRQLFQHEFRLTTNSLRGTTSRYSEWHCVATVDSPLIDLSNVATTGACTGTAWIYCRCVLYSTCVHTCTVGAIIIDTLLVCVSQLMTFNPLPNPCIHCTCLLINVCGCPAQVLLPAHKLQ